MMFSPVSILLLLLFLLSNCGTDSLHFVTDDLRVVTDDPTFWVTWKVDSLNVGFKHETISVNGEESLQTIGQYRASIGHYYVYGPIYFRSEAQLPTALLGPGERWLEDEREAICRICLRHEWQACKSVPEPKLKTAFEKLQEKLVR